LQGKVERILLKGHCLSVLGNPSTLTRANPIFQAFPVRKIIGIQMV
jgi:hypothetical protein